jgi:hypothetical protein
MHNNVFGPNGALKFDGLATNLGPYFGSMGLFRMPKPILFRPRIWRLIPKLGNIY